MDACLYILAVRTCTGSSMACVNSCGPCNCTESSSLLSHLDNTTSFAPVAITVHGQERLGEAHHLAQPVHDHLDACTLALGMS